MNVLVTGAAGRLGSAVVSELVAQGFDVRATDNRFDASLPVRVVPADLLDRHACYRLLEGCDTLVHLANHPNVSERTAAQVTYSENVTMTGNVVLAARDVGVRRIVYASSIQVIAGDRRGDEPQAPSGLAYLPLDGDLPARPGNVYALSKVAGEQLLQLLCRQHSDLTATALRYPALWRADWGRSSRAGRRRRSGQWLSLADEGFSYLPTDDAARLVAAVLRRQRVGYHCYLPATPDNSLGWPLQELVDTYYPNVPRKHPGRPLEAMVDTAAITEAVGWSPSPPPVEDPVAAAASTG